MDKSTQDYINNIFTYQEFYRFLSPGDKTMHDVREYVKALTVSDSTKRRYITMVTAEDERFLVKDGVVLINKDQVLEQVSIILKELQVASNDMSKAALEEKDAEIKNLRMEFENANKEFMLVSNELADVKKKVIHEQQNGRDWEYRCKLIDQKQMEEQLNRKVVFAKNMTIIPAPDFDEAAFVDDAFVELDIPKSISKYGGEKKSYYSVSDETDASTLTEKNYLKRIAAKLMSEKVFKKWAQEVNAEREFNLSHGIVPKESEGLKRERSHSYEKKSDVERHADNLIRRRTAAVQKIMNDDRLSDQMKLQMYARFGKYHGTELERLINFVADYGINAKWFIQVIEDPDTMDNYENIRDYLRMFSKPSEYRKKMDFARELIDGEWKIQLDYNGKPTIFTLVPVREINDIRERLHLPPSEFTCKDLEVEVKIPEATMNAVIGEEDKSNQTDVMREEIKKKPVMDLSKPEFVKTYVFKEDEPDCDAEEFGLEPEAIDYGEYEETE